MQRVYDLATTGREGNSRRWEIVSCPACGGVASFETDLNAIDIQAVYPEVVGEWRVDHLPTTIERDWDEAIDVFRVGAYASAVVACGRTLEAAADHLDITGTLQQRITKMLDQDLITAQFRDAMDYVRLIRNTGAHAGAEVSVVSAQGTMRFTLQALRLLFEVPGELDALQKRPPELDQDDKSENE